MIDVSHVRALLAVQVFPPAFAMPLIAGFYAACHAALPDSPAAAGSLFSGGLMGYIFYDCIHHFAHSRKFKHPWLVRCFVPSQTDSSVAPVENVLSRSR